MKLFSDFIKKNFIEKIINLFNECFDIISSFKDLIEIIRKISSNIIRICKNIINFIKGIKDIKITQIPKLISNSKDTIELFNCVREKLESLPKLIKEIMNKFNFEKKIS